MMYKVIIVAFLSVYSTNYTNGLCANKSALAKVDAWVHRRLKGNGNQIDAVNFNLLDDYLMIDVTNANITELCEGMIKNFPKLQTLSLINVNLSKIEAGAFQNVPRLKHLSLSVNNLTEIKSGYFATIPRLSILYLSRNQIEFIEEDAFINMTELKAVHLDRNKITQLNGNAFRACPKINYIDFSVNLIETISKNAFADIRPVQQRIVEIRLINNKISRVEEEAFSDLPSVNLHLERNRLNGVSSLFHSLKEDSGLFLNQNNIECIPDDVVELMRNTSKDLYLLDNPLTCECLDRIDGIIGEEVYGRGKLHYNTTLQCHFRVTANQIYFN